MSTKKRQNTSQINFSLFYVFNFRKKVDSLKQAGCWSFYNVSFCEASSSLLNRLIKKIPLWEQDYKLEDVMREKRGWRWVGENTANLILLIVFTKWIYYLHRIWTKKVTFFCNLWIIAPLLSLVGVINSGPQLKGQQNLIYFTCHLLPHESRLSTGIKKWHHQFNESMLFT